MDLIIFRTHTTSPAKSERFLKKRGDYASIGCKQSKRYKFIIKLIEKARIQPKRPSRTI